MTALSPRALGSSPATLAFISAMATWASLGCPALMFSVLEMTFDEQPVVAEYDPPKPRCRSALLASEPLDEDECALSIDTLFKLAYWLRRSSAVSHCCRLAALSERSRRCGK
jgi:hypothetical protein